MKKLFFIILLVSSGFGQYKQPSAGINRGSIDQYTNAVKIVDYAHYEDHAGSGYEYTAYQDVGNTDSVIIAITTPNTGKWGHLLMEASVEAEFAFIVKEDASVTGGTTVTPINKNRNSSKVSTMTIKAAPTISDTGEVIRVSKAGERRNAGGTSRAVGELLLKQGVTTLLIAINQSGATRWISQQLTWYEHTNKQ